MSGCGCNKCKVCGGTGYVTERRGKGELSYPCPVCRKR